MTPLNWVEWKAVLLFSIPVIFLDEVLKFITRNFIQPVGKSFLHKVFTVKMNGEFVTLR